MYKNHRLTLQQTAQTVEMSRISSGRFQMLGKVALGWCSIQETCMKMDIITYENVDRHRCSDFFSGIAQQHTDEQNSQAL